MHFYLYIYIKTHIYICIYIYIYLLHNIDFVDWDVRMQVTVFFGAFILRDIHL